MGKQLIGAGTLVENSEGEFLIVQEQKQPVTGQWTIPSGGYDKGETIRQTARRETEEETGLEVELEGVVGLYFRDSEKLSDYKSVMLVFKSKVVSGEVLQNQNEIQRVRFSDIDEIRSLPLRFDITRVIEDYRENGLKEIPIHHYDN
jgi:8-oxo-dGTP diphosphatase